MFYLRTIVFSLLILILSEAIALTAVTWSFLESSSSSFAFIKIGSDNRARDTIVSLAKASEVRMKPKGFEELNKTFSRLVDVTAEDPDGFRVKEVSLLSPKHVVLASSDEAFTTDSLRKRKPNEKYSDEVFTRAFRMRKWQYPDPVLLEKQKNLLSPGVSNPGVFSADWFFVQLEPVIIRFMPEVLDTRGLVSSAVYHETKLDVVGAIHLIYERGNFFAFIQKQKEIFVWMLFSYGLIALGVSVILILVYILFLYFHSREIQSLQKVLLESEPSPPIIEKVVVAGEEGLQEKSEEDNIPELKTEREELNQVLETTNPTDLQEQTNLKESTDPKEHRESVRKEKDFEPLERNPELKSSFLTRSNQAYSSLSISEKESQESVGSGSAELEKEKKRNMAVPLSNKKIVVDAMYLGEYGD